MCRVSFPGAADPPPQDSITTRLNVCIAVTVILKTITNACCSQSAGQSVVLTSIDSMVPTGLQDGEAQERL